MGSAKRAAKMVDVIDLEDGETVEVATVAEIGSMRRPAAEGGVVTTLGTAAALATGVGLIGLARRVRMGVVLTNRRLILVNANQSTGRFLGAASEARRSGLARGPARSSIYLSYDILDSDNGEPIIKLSFPLPNKSAGQQIGEALPEREEVNPSALEPQESLTSTSTGGAWWPDPLGQARLRYHDGTQWTDHTHM